MSVTLKAHFACAVLLAAVAACGNSKSANPTSAKGAAQTMERTHCAGRYQFSVPASFGIAGRSQSIFDVDVETRVEPADAVAKERSAKIQSIHTPPGVDKIVVRTFQILPGTSAVLYHRDPETSGLLALEAIRPFPDHALVANRGLDLRGAPSNALEIVETLVKNVVNAYRPSTDRGFCIGMGAITGEAGDDEQALLTLDDTGAKELDIRFRTYMVSEPDTRTHSNLDEESNLGVPLTVLREGTRMAAGVEGREFRIAFAPSNEPAGVRFTWHFPGVGARADLPSIDIVASARKQDQARLEAAWESLLNSLRKVPMQ